MKTKQVIKIIILSIYITHSYAQESNLTKNSSVMLYNAFNTMHTNAELKKKNLLCGVEKIVEDYTFVLNKYTFTSTLNYVQQTIDDINELKDLIDKGAFATKFDKIFEMYEPSMSYSDFIKDVANRSVSELSERENLKLKNVYDLFKAMDKGGKLTFHDADPNETGDCLDFTSYHLTLKKKNLSQVTWEIKTVVNIDCDCKEKRKKYKLDNLKFEYTAEVSGIFTSSMKTFGRAVNPNLKIINYQCCPEKKEEEQPSETALNSNEGIDDLMPDQTIGIGAGVGFSQDFDETTFCVTAEYLYQINTDEYKGWYVGGEATYQNTSFGDTKSSRTVVGGKFQHNFSAVPSGETQFTVGLMGNYAFGNNEFSGFKDDFNGTIFCAYGGANIRVSEDWSIGFQFPFLIFENFTFRPESGGEFKTDATSLFINKDNPLKIILRRRL